jgi:ATP phosphoribosyltransferase
MAEKDVAIQIAVGNYDIGFCGLDWIKEHTIRYRSTQLHIFRHLGLNQKKLYACTGADSGLNYIDDLKKIKDFVVIVSEYPNIAEYFAIHYRLKKFKVFSAWGSVEAYPPEHADLVILAVTDEAAIHDMALLPIDTLIESDLCLIVNRKSFAEKPLSPVLEFFGKTAL